MYRNTVLRLQLSSSGLGVPDRRYSLGGFTGAFRFLAWQNFESNAVKIAPCLCATPCAQKFLTQQVKRLIALFWPKTMQPHRPRHQACKLQTR